MMKKVKTLHECNYVSRMWQHFVGMEAAGASRFISTEQPHYMMSHPQ